MTTREDRLVAAGPSVGPGRWLGVLDELMTRIGSRFSRVEPRRRARAFVLGLLAELPRKNCWTIAEHAGDPSPDRMQHLLARAKWDAGGVRDDVRGYVIEHLGDPGAVLVIDETGDVKKGTATAGVQRQYTGTAGRIENAQVAVYLGYAAPRGHALIDRELYLPRSWTDDPGRCAAAGIPATVTFATKPQLAKRMIERAAGAAVPFAWVAGDEVYGDNGPLRTWLETRRTGYVLAVACDHRVPAGAGHTIRADQLAARLPRKAWQRLSAGTGAKGHRWYDWAWVTINDPGPGHRQARRWTSWYRWVTLAMLAAAALTIAAALEHAHGPGPADQIPLTRNEIAHLLSSLTIRPAHDTTHQMRWSSWRRRHQHRARTCHYQRQTAKDQGT